MARRYKKDPREGQLTDKDMTVLREADSAYAQHKMSRGVLRDYSLKHQVTLEWDLNDDAKKDLMFKLRIGDNEAILDAEQMRRLLRWI